MSSGTSDDASSIENLPTPGAAPQSGNRRLPTLDGEPIPIGEPLPFSSLEQALAEAVKRVEHGVGPAIEVKLGSLVGCCMTCDETIVVASVAGARRAILRYADEALGDHQRDHRQREHLRLPGGTGRPTWDDLAKCETSRHYDLDDAEAGMSCSYVLYQQGGLEGVGGVIWSFGVSVWATAPPSVWGCPADQPVDSRQP